MERNYEEEIEILERRYELLSDKFAISMAEKDNEIASLMGQNKAMFQELRLLRDVVSGKPSNA